MVIRLADHGLGPRGNSLRGESAFDVFKKAVSSGFQDVVGDKGVKSQIVVQAVRAVTGVDPIVDTSDPAVTWVRMRPEHGEFIDSTFTKAAKKITAGPSAGKVADFKVDLVPALKPFLIRRALPVVGGVFLAGLVVGYLLKRK
jgi:hypothetical protein